jgi:hypothetical protein
MKWLVRIILANNEAGNLRTFISRQFFNSLNNFGCAHAIIIAAN